MVFIHASIQLSYYGDPLGIVVELLGLRNQRSQVSTFIGDPSWILEKRNLHGADVALSIHRKSNQKPSSPHDASQQSRQIHMT
ncbi:hypothetical protein TNCV_2118951 [Trichonephila clavipes]|nr:hypothetical protein TNCV_2118951 [Trichonephila clavipes]